LAGKCRSNSIVASNPPADPPTPTIGQLKCFLAGFDLARFDCGDLVLLAFIRERDALLFDLRFATMAFLMLIPSRASYKLPFSSGHLHETEQASPSVSRDVPLEGDASSHRFYCPGVTTLVVASR
jgi:hypothetical protein